MRIIFLNTSHAEQRDALFEFISKQSINVDVFCFLEVTMQMFSDFSKVLNSFDGKYIANTLRSGQSIFVKNNISIISDTKVELYEQKVGDSGCLQKIKVGLNNSEILVGCVHGTALPGTKFDTDIRLKQSEIILKSFEDDSLPIIIGGDFNLLPETRSIKMFEEKGYINLIQYFNIRNTRNRIAWEQFKDEPGFVKQHFADYCFVSPNIKVANFEVPNIEVSDHLPLILDFTI